MLQGNFLYKCVNDQQFPQQLRNFFNFNQNVHKHNTRSSGLLHIPRHRKHLFEHSIRYTGTRHWNNLPKSLKKLSKLKCFSYKVKKKTFEMLSSITIKPLLLPHIPIYSLCSTLSQLACIVYWIRVDCIWFCIVQYCKGMPITSSALGAMPPSSMQTFVNYSYCIDHLLKEINLTLKLNWTYSQCPISNLLGPLA